MKSTARTALATALRAADDALMYWDQLQAVKRLGTPELLVEGNLEARMVSKLHECNCWMHRFEAAWEPGDTPETLFLSSYLRIFFDAVRQARAVFVMPNWCFHVVQTGQFGEPTFPPELASKLRTGEIKTFPIPEELLGHLQRIREIRQLINKTWPEAMISPNDSDDPEVSEPRTDPDPAARQRYRLGNFGDTPIIDGDEQERLSPEQYDILFAIRNAGSTGLDMHELESICGDARGVLRRLLESQPAWQSQVKRAGKKGGRYCWIGNTDIVWIPRPTIPHNPPESPTIIDM